MKVGDKFKPNQKFWEQFGCHRLRRLVEGGFVLEVVTMPSKSGRYKYGFYHGGWSYGFDDEHVIPSKPKQLENK